MHAVLVVYILLIALVLLLIITDMFLMLTRAPLHVVAGVAIAIAFVVGWLWMNGPFVQATTWFQILPPLIRTIVWSRRIGDKTDWMNRSMIYRGAVFLLTFVSLFSLLSGDAFNDPTSRFTPVELSFTSSRKLSDVVRTGTSRFGAVD